MKKKITRRNAIIGTTAAFTLSTILSHDQTLNSPDSSSQDNLTKLPNLVPRKPSTPVPIYKETPLAKITKTLEEVSEEMATLQTDTKEEDRKALLYGEDNLNVED